MQGRIFADIRAGIPPANPHPVCDSEAQNVWNLLGQCWEREPSRRPSAQKLLAALQLLLDEAQSADFDFEWGPNIDDSLSRDNATEQTRRETSDENKKTPPVDAGLKMNPSHKVRGRQSIPGPPIASVNVESGEHHTWDPILRTGKTVGDMDIRMRTKNSNETGSFTSKNLASLLG
jgi:hypothetical protein